MSQTSYRILRAATRFVSVVDGTWLRVGPALNIPIARLRRAPRLVVFVTAMASLLLMPVNASAGKKARCVGQGRSGGWDVIRHISHGELITQEIEAAENELRTPDIASLPRGGFIVATINRHSITSANPEHFEMVFSFAGEIIGREEGPDKIPNVPKSTSGPWWSVWAIRVPTQERTVGFSLIDKINGVRCDAAIDTYLGNVKRLKP